jgi:hypothetical protein
MHECMPTAHSDWGWCQPECEEESLQPEVHRCRHILFFLQSPRLAHETAVDAFVYENCSRNVNTFTEFCTGTKISSGYGQVCTALHCTALHCTALHCTALPYGQVWTDEKLN